MKLPADNNCSTRVGCLFLSHFKKKTKTKTKTHVSLQSNKRIIDRIADGEVLKSPQIPDPILANVTESNAIGHQSSLVCFPISSNHDTTPALTLKSPVCAKKGNRRCVKLGHLIECDIHKGKYHSIRFECVSCAEACAREEKATKKDQGPCSAEAEKKQQKKSRKRGKVKASHEKTMKQLRKELREEKRTSSSD